MKKYNKNFFWYPVLVMMIGCSMCIYRYLKGKDPVWFDPVASNDDVAWQIEKATLETLNQYNENGITGLMYAVIAGDQDRARWLLDRGVDVNIRSANRKSNDSAPEKDSALHLAVRNSDDNEGYEIALMMLADKRVDPNIENHGCEKPIHYIIHVDDLDRRVELIKKLIERGADINAINYEGNTFVHLSVEQNSRDWIDRLQEEFGWKHEGGKIDLGIKNNQGHTPYLMAMTRGFGDLAAALRTGSEQEFVL